MCVLFLLCYVARDESNAQSGENEKNESTACPKGAPEGLLFVQFCDEV